MSEELEARIVELETTVAFLTDKLEKFEALLSEQQLELHRHEAAFKDLRRTVKEIQPSMIRDAADEEPPPHY